MVCAILFPELMKQFIFHMDTPLLAKQNASAHSPSGIINYHVTGIVMAVMISIVIRSILERACAIVGTITVFGKDTL